MYIKSPFILHWSEGGLKPLKVGCLRHWRFFVLRLLRWTGQMDTSGKARSRVADSPFRSYWRLFERNEFYQHAYN